MNSSFILAVLMFQDRRTRCGLVAALSFGCLAISGSGIAWAQHSSCPVKPVTLVVPFPAGGATDSSAHLFAKVMRESLRQSMVIENQAERSASRCTLFLPL